MRGRAAARGCAFAFALWEAVDYEIGEASNPDTNSYVRFGPPDFQP
jgi:hypothetical protein